MVKVFIYLTLLLLLTFVLVQPILRNFSMEKYEWLPTESAHPEYPMTIIEGYLHLEDGSSIYIPSKKVVDNGWGEIGSIHVVGSTMKALPVRMSITWFSYAENKFYTGTFDLPFDRINKLFAEGLQSPLTHKKITYEKIIVGMAPGGEVSVWLLAEGVVLHVASFTAKEDNVDWSRMTENETYTRSRYVRDILRESLSKDQLELLEKDGIPFQTLDMYKKQYMWNLEVIGQKRVHAWVKTYNGEMEFFGTNGGNQARSHRAHPKEMQIIWQGLSGKSCSGTITFNGEEVVKAYAKVSAGNVNHPMALLVEISDNNHIEISLTDSKHILPLTKVSVKVYDAEGYWERNAL